MKVLITYPVGLLLKAYMLYASILIKIKEKRSQDATKKPTVVKESKLQTAQY